MMKSKYAAMQQQILCACGCGGWVTTPDLKGRARLFLRGHQNKNKRGWRWGKGELAQHRGEKVQCACGCGTWIEKYGASGKLVRFVAGHQSRGQTSNQKGTGKKNSAETKECGCGCGTVILKYNSSGRERFYVNGHNARGKPGHLLGKKQPASQGEKLSRYRIANPQTIHSGGRWTNYNGQWFRTKSEAERAEQLDLMGYTWIYEPREDWAKIAYVDGKGKPHQYLPDFYVYELNRYEEVKGYDIEKIVAREKEWKQLRADREKMEWIVSQNPNITIAIVDRAAIRVERKRLIGQGKEVTSWFSRYCVQAQRRWRQIYLERKTDAPKLVKPKVVRKDRAEMIECACGCGQMRPRYDRNGCERRYILGHVQRGRFGARAAQWNQEKHDKIAEARKLKAVCECGCGGLVNINRFGIPNRFVYGHNRRKNNLAPLPQLVLQ